MTTYPAELSDRILSQSTHFPTAKAVHISAYALLTALVPWVWPARACWFLLAGLSAHACVTEYLQQWVAGRHSDLADVGFNHLGILLGVAVGCAWLWWSRGRGPEA